MANASGARQSRPAAALMNSETRRCPWSPWQPTKQWQHEGSGVNRATSLWPMAARAVKGISHANEFSLFATFARSVD